MSSNRPNRPNDALANYVPVAERIESFYKKFPQGRILTTIVDHDRESGFILFRAEVYRDHDDATPAASGHAYEYKDAGYVQKTSYIELGETSAVGRALAFLNFETKRGIASREEMDKQSRPTIDASPRPPRVEAARPELPRAEPPRATMPEEVVIDEPRAAAPTLGAPAASGGRLPNLRPVAGANAPASAEQKSEILGLLEQLRPRDRKAQRALLMEKTGKGSREDLDTQEARRLIDELKA